MTLPTWNELDAKQMLVPLDPLEQFIYDQEPAGRDDEDWREQLLHAVIWTVSRDLYYLLR